MKNGGLKIEKGIPLPPRKDRHDVLVPFLKQLKPTESVFVHCCKATAYLKAKEALGLGNFRVHSEKDGVRVWRIK